MQGCGAVHSFDVGVGPGLEQGLDDRGGHMGRFDSEQHRDVAGVRGKFDGPVQRGGTIPAADVGVGAGFEQGLDRRGVPVERGRPEKRCDAVFVSGIKGAAGREEHLDDRGVLVQSGGPVQRRKVEEVGCVRVGAFPQTTFDVSDRGGLKELRGVPLLAVNPRLGRG